MTPGTPRPELKALPGSKRRGVALIEFALILPVLVILVMGTFDIGRLIQTRIIISNVSREGGSVASRQDVIDTGLTNLLAISGKPLDLAGADGRIYITRVAAGVSATLPNPTIETQQSIGSLGIGSRIGTGSATLGLPSNLYNHLVFKTANSTSDISEVTVVEVAFKYRPVTPLPNFAEGMLLPDNGGMIIVSRAIF
jgi:hypothetical protein